MPYRPHYTLGNQEIDDIRFTEKEEILEFFVDSDTPMEMAKRKTMHSVKNQDLDRITAEQIYLWDNLLEICPENSNPKKKHPSCRNIESFDIRKKWLCLRNRLFLVLMRIGKKSRFKARPILSFRYPLNLRTIGKLLGLYLILLVNILFKVYIIFRHQFLQK